MTFSGRWAGSLYALVDVVRDDGSAEAIVASGIEHWVIDKLVGPWVISATPPGSLLERLYASAGGMSAFTFFASTAGRNDLKKHLHGLTRVRTEDDRPLYFRYHDPRVLRVFLPTCTSDQLSEMFGPIGEFVVPAKHGPEMLVFGQQSGRLETHTLSSEGFETLLRAQAVSQHATAPEPVDASS